MPAVTTVFLKLRARPKSATFTCPSEVNRTVDQERIKMRLQKRWHRIAFDVKGNTQLIEQRIQKN